MKKISLVLTLSMIMLFMACEREKWSEYENGNLHFVEHREGPTLGFSSASGVGILEVDGFAFKDLNQNGVLEQYEDWRLTVEERARDLASRMSIEEISGLMLYSRHQSIPAGGGGFGGPSTYGGAPYIESDANPWDLTDQQLRFLTEDNLRHVLITADVAAVDVFSGKPWGIEHLNIAERHFKAIDAGIDQFGGNNEMGPVIEAYQMGVEKYGEDYMRERFETSAVRLLRNMFNTGLFENPYVDVENTMNTVGNPDFMLEGYEAQVKSVVMLKNSDQTLPVYRIRHCWRSLPGCLNRQAYCHFRFHPV